MAKSERGLTLENIQEFFEQLPPTARLIGIDAGTKTLTIAAGNSGAGVGAISMTSDGPTDIDLLDRYAHLVEHR